jgi:signal transduction histidine kinase
MVEVDHQLKAKNVYLKKRFMHLIFDNLIANAVKYAYPKTKILVSSKNTKDGFYVTVLNHGFEIEDKDIDDIFMPFYRNKNHENTQKGYGLGLAIVKKATEALNIQVFVKSENNTTSFSLFFKT